MSSGERALRAVDTVPADGTEKILRFRLSERQMHWAIAIPFMICYSTAVVLMTFYNPHPERPYRAVVSWIHRGSGLALFALPLWTLIQHWYDFAIHRANIGEVWRWTLADLKWLFLMGPSTLNKNIELPDQGKFNAAEKLNFMMLMMTLPVYFVSGALIWMHEFVFSAWVMHLSMAAIATVLLGGHIFMATINPDTRVGLSGMITGYVSRHWASHHYALWYRANFEHAGAKPESPAAVTSPSPALVTETAGGGEALSFDAGLSVSLPAEIWPAAPAPDAPAPDAARVTNRQLRLVEPRSEPDDSDDADLDETAARPLPPFMYPVQPRVRTGTN